MRNCYLLLLTLLTVIVVRDGIASKCNDDVIDQIRNLWLQKGTPQGLLTQLLNARVSYIVATTDGVFEGEENILCLEAVTTESYYFLKFFYNNGSTLESEKIVLEEKPGDLYNSEDKQHRYHIPTLPNSNIHAFYSCQEEGSSGDDRGLIRVVGHSNSLTEAAVQEAIKDFNSLGITISTFYRDHCEVTKFMSIPAKLPEDFKKKVTEVRVSFGRGVTPYGRGSGLHIHPINGFK